MKDENTKLVKIKESSNAAMIVARIAKVFCIVAVMICVITGLVLMIFRNQFNEELAAAEAAGEFSVEELMMELSVFEGLGKTIIDNVSPGNIAGAIGGCLVVIGVILIFPVVIMHFVEKVFKEIKDGDSPFRQSVLKKLWVLFILLTLFALSSSIMFGLVIGFSLWCVLRMFEYGCELQRLSDETL